MVAQLCLDFVLFFVQYSNDTDVLEPVFLQHGTPLNTRSSATERTFAAIFFSAATYFVHFFALGFGSFPLQTHLRTALTPATASLVASIIPLASCLTYFFFRFAQRRGWMSSPRLVLFFAAIGMGCMQLILGWRMHHAMLGHFVVGPFVDIALCMLFLGCVQSSVMTLLHHIGVSTMGDYAFSVRAAGSAGYMFALLLMGTFSKSDQQVAEYHLFLGAGISALHASVAWLAWFLSPHETMYVGSNREVPIAPVQSKKDSIRHEAIAAKPIPTDWEWMGLLVLVWLVAICEMSYGLYAHEFLTQTYGSYGYFVFASAVAIEIALLVCMPLVPGLKKQLLFIGPLGWIMLFAGCLMATQGMTAFGLAGLALALNCPFQISTNEHAHRMNPSVMGVASMTLAQSLGYMTATLIASVASRFTMGPSGLWVTVLPLAGLALFLAIRKLARENAALDVNDLCQASGVSGSGTVASVQECSNDLEGQLGTDHSSADAEDVHVVMLNSLSSGIRVVTEAGANPRELVRRHAHANS
jgi:hypothetical protein